MTTKTDAPDEPLAGSMHAIVGAPLVLITTAYLLGAALLIHASIWTVATAYILLSALMIGGVVGEKQAYNTVKDIAENSLDGYWRRQLVRIPLARISWPLGCILVLFVAQGWTFAHLCRCISIGSPQAFFDARGHPPATDDASVFRWMNYSIDRLVEIVSLGATGIYDVSISGIHHNPESLDACHVVFSQSAVLSLTLITLLINAVLFGLKWFRGQQRDGIET